MPLGPGTESNPGNVRLCLGVGCVTFLQERRDRTSKISIKAERKLVGWDNDYLLSILYNKNAVALPNSTFGTETLLLDQRALLEQSRGARPRGLAHHRPDHATFTPICRIRSASPALSRASAVAW